MLVIMSDLHLTDGSSGKTIPPLAFRIFRQRLRDLAYDASWRSTPDGTGVYQPIEKLDIILLGDILDVIRSDKWLKNNPQNVRPWDVEKRAAQVAQKIEEITDLILHNNNSSFEVLRHLNKANDTDSLNWITIPPARDGKPDPAVPWEPKDRRRVSVKVDIHYMVGNHDWFYHLGGSAYDAMRKKIVDALGLTNDPAVPFPHDPSESAKIPAVLREHRVFARHGDIFDAFNYDKQNGRDASSLGDAIVIELLNRFPSEVAKLELLPDSVKAGFKEIDNVRPYELIPVWIDGLLQSYHVNRPQRKEVMRVWDRLVDDFLGLDFVKRQASFWNPLNAVTQLRMALKFSQGLSLGLVSWAINRFRTDPVQKFESYFKNALTEVAFKNQQAKHIVYGHTHHQEIVPLDVVPQATAADLKQIYFNSGTWRTVHEKALAQPNSELFVTYQVMTYFAFFKDDERGGRPFECWSGTLGL